jgi:hypothetical protein
VWDDLERPISPKPTAIENGAAVALRKSSTVVPGAISLSQTAVNIQNSQIGDYAVNYGPARVGKRASLEDLGRTLASDVLHGSNYALRALDQVHRATHAFDYLPRSKVAISTSLCLARCRFPLTATSRTG